MFRVSRRLLSTGRQISRRADVYPEIYQALGIKTASSVECIFTKPQWKRIFTLNSSINPYGHSVIRYDHPDRGNVIMNVCGQPDQSLINFFPAEDFLLTDELHPGNEQGGIFNRSFIGARVEGVDASTIVQLHQNYTELDQKHKQGEIMFSLFDFFFTNPVRRALGYPVGGNCSYWTSLGLQEVGLMKSPSGFPMFMLLKFLLTQKDLSRINIISYRSVNYDNEPNWSLVHPIYGRYLNLRDVWHYDFFANIVVKPVCHNGVWTVEIEKREHVRDMWLDVNHKLRKSVGLD